MKMNPLLLTVVLLGFLFTSTAFAQFQHTPPSSSPITISYGLSSLTFLTEPLTPVKIEPPTPKNSGIALSMVKPAEADEASFAHQDFDKIVRTINDASRLEDLKGVLSDDYYQLLQTKVKEGVSQYTVLAMLKAMHPDHIRLMDYAIIETKAQLAVSGESYLGPMQGLIVLNKIDGIWKIDNERWYAEGTRVKNTRNPVGIALSTIPEEKKSELLTGLSPDYRLNTNVLSLVNIVDNRRKRAFMFTFVMNKPKVSKAEAEADKSSRARLHIMGPRIINKQTLVKNKYPLDISMAYRKDGYAQREWNLILPGRKPREVMVSLLWSF